jgi:hypothetical protein
MLDWAEPDDAVRLDSTEAIIIATGSAAHSIQGRSGLACWNKAFNSERVKTRDIHTSSTGSKVQVAIVATSRGMPVSSKPKNVV